MEANGAFSEYIKIPEQTLELGRAALLIARAEYPDLEVKAYLDRLDVIAAAVQAYLRPEPSPEERLLALNQTLFEDLGFNGNTDDYYDPRNSFLNDVLDRRLGIPITLSVLYMEVGWRLGLPLEGVAFPGHFLVKMPMTHGDVVLDPFFRGMSLSETELVSRVVQTFGKRRLPYLDLRQLLAGAGKKDILARMLRNLKHIYLQNKEMDRVLAVSNWILAAAPGSAEDIRDRGLILEYMECPRAAISDYRHYLELAPDADDQEMIAERMLALESSAPSIN